MQEMTTEDSMSRKAAPTASIFFLDVSAKRPNLFQQIDTAFISQTLLAFPYKKNEKKKHSRFQSHITAAPLGRKGARGRPKRRSLSKSIPPIHM
jgi:hypothetical protein